MQNGTVVEITRLVPEYRLKMGDRGTYVKSINMGNNLGIVLHRVLIKEKEYQLREEEFVSIEEKESDIL